MRRSLAQPGRHHHDEVQASAPAVLIGTRDPRLIADRDEPALKNGAQTRLVQAEQRVVQRSSA
eukprot:512-Eustigmatos_ZCMA.PRE.1